MNQPLASFFEENAKLFDIDMAFLYGSWARGYPRKNSDIDIAIVFSSVPASEDKEFELITEISLKLSQIMKREVNIISIHEDFPKPMLYYNAIVLGVPVYIKHFARYIALKLYAIYLMEDFCLFGIRWQLEVARKNLMGLRYA